jgi:N-acetylmuramoyl-L-alanine amidase
MLNKRTKIISGALCVILGAAILAVPVLSRNRYDAMDTFAPAGHDHTVIIDAGHGGADGGAVSLGGVYESDINLAISLKLEQIMAFMGICPVMTREAAEIDYPEDAVTIRQKKVFDQKTGGAYKLKIRRSADKHPSEQVYNEFTVRGTGAVCRDGSERCACCKYRISSRRGDRY